MDDSKREDDYEKRAREFEKQIINRTKERGNFQGTLIVVSLIFLAGSLFSFSSLTGNIIGITKSNLLGFIFLIIAFIMGSFYINKKRKY